MPDPISWGFAWPYLLGALAGGYLFGSIPFGLVICKLAGLGDIRTQGSGNIGATNVARTGRKGLALLTFLLDAGKGGIVTLIAYFGFGPDAAVLAAFGSVLGHMLPVWIGFKGGKGVSTTFGVLLVLSLPVGLICGAIWVGMAKAFRYSSLAALVSLTLAPVLMFPFDGVHPLDHSARQLAEVTAAIAVLVWIAHAKNVRRLIAGTESKIGEKKSATPVGKAES